MKYTFVWVNVFFFLLWTYLTLFCFMLTYRDTAGIYDVFEWDFCRIYSHHTIRWNIRKQRKENWNTASMLFLLCKRKTRRSSESKQFSFSSALSNINMIHVPDVCVGGMCIPIYIRQWDGKISVYKESIRCYIMKVLRH